MVDAQRNKSRGASAPGEITQLLVEWRDGDDSALNRLIPLVYGELRSAARRCLRHERRNDALQPTVLVNEVYLRLIGSRRVRWRDRAHFFAVSAQLMRRVLIDEARKRGNQKRGGDYTRMVLSEEMAAVPEQHVDVLSLNEALDRLGDVAPRKYRVVEMRCFGGLTVEETAAVLDVSTDIVKREWRTAKMWLLRALGKAGDGPGAMERS
jgi:RNA polymerase sigma-70 factor (ECF subfamily)